MKQSTIGRRALLFLPLIFFGISTLLMALFRWSSGTSAILELTLLAVLILFSVFLEPSLPVVVFYPLFWCAWSYTLPRLGKPDAVIGYLALGAAVIHVVVRRYPLPKLPTLTVIGMWLLFGGYAISWLLFQSFSQGLEFFVSLATRLIFMYLVFLQVRTAAHLRLALSIYLASCAFISLLVLYISIRYGFGFSRVYGLPELITSNIGDFWYKLAFGFSLGGASGLLLMGLYPLVRQLYQRWLIIIGVLFLSWMVFASQYRRESLISFVIMFFLLSISRVGNVRRPALGILIIAAGLFFAALLPNSPILQERLGRESDIARAGDELRQVSFRGGVEAFLDSPILVGSGPGSYPRVVTPRVEPRYYLAYSLHRVDAFNVFIWIAVEGGAIALAGFVLILFGVYRQARVASQWNSKGIEDWVLRCAPVLILQIILWSTFGNSWEVSIIWFLLGLILAAARLAEQNATSQPHMTLSGEA